VNHNNFEDVLHANASISEHAALPPAVDNDSREFGGMQRVAGMLLKLS